MVDDGQRQLAARHVDALRADQVVVERDGEACRRLADGRAGAAAARRARARRASTSRVRVLDGHLSPMLSHPMTRARRAAADRRLARRDRRRRRRLRRGGDLLQLDDEQHAAPRSSTSAARAATRSASAGTQGSATNVRTREYKDGPNFDQRKETDELRRSTRSATAASPRARCRRTSSPARRPRRSREFVAQVLGPERRAPADDAARLPARGVADARPEGDPPRPGAGAGRAGAPARRLRRAAGRARWRSTRGGTRCCPRSRGCGRAQNEASQAIARGQAGRRGRGGGDRRDAGGRARG